MPCYDGFGNMTDGRLIWVGDFSGQGKTEVLFFFPGDNNWWLGTHNGNELAWALVGNTAGFGPMADGRPIWIGNFSGQGKAEVLFFFPGDPTRWSGDLRGEVV